MYIVAQICRASHSRRPIRIKNDGAEGQDRTVDTRFFSCANLRSLASSEVHDRTRAARQDPSGVHLGSPTSRDEGVSQGVIWTRERPRFQTTRRALPSGCLAASGNRTLVCATDSSRGRNEDALEPRPREFSGVPRDENSDGTTSPESWPADIPGASQCPQRGPQEKPVLARPNRASKSRCIRSGSR
jgi:hypothetical protein